MGSVVRQPLLGRRSRRLTLSRPGVAAAALLLASGLLLAGCSATPDPPASGPTALVDPLARDRAVRSLLSQRADAVAARDVAALRATEAEAADVPDPQRLLALPLASWRYDLDALPAYDPAQPTLLRLPVRVAYRFRGEASDTSAPEEIALRYADGAWRVAAESTTGPRAAPWAIGDVAVASGRRSLVVGIGVPRARVRAVAGIADAAVGTVTGVWGRDWSRRAVVVLTATDAQAAAGLGRDDLGQVAAVTTTVGSQGSGSTAAARIWASDETLAQVDATGLSIVLRHEIVHVATGATTTAATPMWLEEGVAELVGYRGSGVPLARSVGDLVAAARAGRAPTSLPTDADFAGASSRLAYQSAHLACDLLARRLGLPGLVRLYRATAAGGGDPATAALTAEWRDEVARLAG